MTELQYQEFANKAVLCKQTQALLDDVERAMLVASAGG